MKYNKSYLLTVNPTKVVPLLNVPHPWLSPHSEQRGGDVQHKGVEQAKTSFYTSQLKLQTQVYNPGRNHTQTLVTELEVSLLITHTYFSPFDMKNSMYVWEQIFDYLSFPATVVTSMYLSLSEKKQEEWGESKEGWVLGYVSCAITRKKQANP